MTGSPADPRRDTATDGDATPDGVAVPDPDLVGRVVVDRPGEPDGGAASTGAPIDPATRPAPRVALALGSGGARGYAHIGAIQVLEERGADIVCLAGSSMGAVIGALHAVGRLDEYTEWARGLSQLDVVRLLDLSLSAPGAIRAEKVLARVRDLLGDVTIEDLPIPYTAVATDLMARKEVWFQRGPVHVAIRASIAIPGVVTPVMLNGRLLADGGIMDPVPIGPTAAVHADATIAVSLAGEHRGTPEVVAEGAPVRETAEDLPAEEWADRFRRSAAQLFDRDLVRSLKTRFGIGDDELEQHAGDEVDANDPYGALPAGLGKFDVMNQSLDVMQSVLIRYRMAGFPPDVLVEVPRDACRSLDFHRAEELIELGRRITTEALDRCDVPGLRAPS